MVTFTINPLKIKDVILIGHSFGGKISLAYASKYDVYKLVLTPKVQFYPEWLYFLPIFQILTEIKPILTVFHQQRREIIQNCKLVLNIHLKTQFQVFLSF